LVQESAFFSILELNEINLSLGDKAKIIKNCVGNSSTGPGPSSGTCKVNFKEALGFLNIDFENSGETLKWIVRDKTNNQKVLA